MNLKFLITFTTILTAFTSSALANYDQKEEQKELAMRGELQQECLINKKHFGKSYHIQCEKNFHHYNSSAFKKNYSKRKALANGQVKISEFNVLHPGMGKSRFKDYKKIAQIINEFDVVGVTELIPLVDADYKNNMAVLNFIKDAPAEIAHAKELIRRLSQSINASSRGTVTKRRERELLERKVQQLKDDLKDAKSVLREPGYLKILTALHKLHNGDEWALILSPRGEGAATSFQKELVGYYYRTSVVKPKINQYCKSTRKYGAASPMACIVRMDAIDLGKDKRNLFSRRPFMAEFISGRFSFALLTSHVLFDSPKDPSVMRRMVRSAFGVNSYEQLGPGVTKNKYARFVEVKTTLDFIKNYLTKGYSQKDIIFMGDFNLEKSNPFWKTVIQSWPGAELFISDKTSVKESRYDSLGNPSNGVSSNYDHFIFDPQETDECVDSYGKIRGGAYNFTKGNIASYLNRIYKVRQERMSRGVYVKNQEKYRKAMNRFVTPYLNGYADILTVGKKYITYGRHKIATTGIKILERETLEQGEFFKKRVLDSQFHNESYYYYFEQLLSDHLPIYMSCSNN